MNGEGPPSIHAKRLRGAPMSCPYFESGDEKTCNVFAVTFDPDPLVIERYCSCLNHKFCPFHISVTTDRHISRLDTFIRTASGEESRFGKCPARVSTGCKGD